MLHLFHFVWQVITLPTQITDLAQWLLIPAVLGGIATFFVSLIPVSDPPTPDQTRNKNIVRVVSYAVVGLLSYFLTQLPPTVLQSFQGAFIVLMAVVAAYFGDTAIKAVAGALRSAALVLQFIGLRLAFGSTKAHEVWVSPNHGG